MSDLKPLDQYLNECEANPGRKFASTPGYPTGILCPCNRGELIAFIGGHPPELTATFCRECGTERSIPRLPPTPSERPILKPLSIDRNYTNDCGIVALAFLCLSATAALIWWITL